MPRSIELDSLDWKILAELQADGSLTNVELARRVGLTPPPCLRRVRTLRDAGLIRGFRAILDTKALGYSVICFAFVQLASQSGADLAAFVKRAASMPQVRECWTMSGDIDFVMKCVTSDLGAFQNFVSELTAVPNVRNVRTALTLAKVKDEGLVPF
ncbi:MAG: Lrp/AsnC family transcriptional regulator [Rhizobiales bacterium]|nr:Lrp/AsnC family transcriptional regulator [Hyphomicrobiales bacterium]